MTVKLQKNLWVFFMCNKHNKSKKQQPSPVNTKKLWHFNVWYFRRKVKRENFLLSSFHFFEKPFLLFHGWIWITVGKSEKKTFYFCINVCVLFCIKNVFFPKTSLPPFLYNLSVSVPPPGMLLYLPIHNWMS